MSEIINAWKKKEKELLARYNRKVYGFYTYAKNNTPVDTGRLKNSLIITGNTFNYTIEYTVPYSKYAFTKQPNPLSLLPIYWKSTSL